MAHAYQHHHFRALPAAQSIGISPPTMYRKIKEWELEDSENPLYAKPFVYQPEIPLKDFRNQLFSAALKHHQKPYATLRALGVSQGFFYKVLREVR